MPTIKASNAILAMSAHIQLLWRNMVVIKYMTSGDSHKKIMMGKIACADGSGQMVIDTCNVMV